MKRFSGTLFLTAVVVIWIGAAVLTQFIFSGDSTDFPKPLFVTYYNTAFFVLYLIPPGVKWLIGNWGRSKRQRPSRALVQSDSFTSQGRYSSYGADGEEQSAYGVGFQL